MNLREQQEILRTVAAADHPNQTALATIVRTRGSTYRGAGARLLVGPDGPLLGNLSGGCLEDEIADACRRVLENGHPEIITYDLSSEDEAIWGWGLGCNGVMDVLIEPVYAVRSVARAMVDALSSGRVITLVTALSSSKGIDRGSHVVLDAGGSVIVSSESDRFDSLVADRSSLMTGGIQTLSFVEVSVERIAPQPRVWIFGAGHDAIPLSAAGAAAGFAVSVIDDRAHLLSSDRFPDAHRLILAAEVGPALDEYLDTFHAAVLMTHNYLKDLGYLEHLVNAPIDHLALLGPRARAEKLLGDLNEKGIDVPPGLEIRGPAGLDIGADGPEEIAVAIVAGLLAAYHGRGGGPLSKREGPIHSNGA